MKSKISGGRGQINLFLYLFSKCSYLPAAVSGSVEQERESWRKVPKGFWAERLPKRLQHLENETKDFGQHDASACPEGATRLFFFPSVCLCMSTEECVFF